MRPPRRRRSNGELDRCGPGVGAWRVESHGKHLGGRRPGVAALRQRRAAAEREQRPAALAHELLQHPELITGEERRLDAAEDDGPELEQLFAPRREAIDQLHAVAHAEPKELVLGASHQPHDLHRAVAGDGPPKEGELGSRLPFDIEHPRRPRANVEHRAVFVVLRHELTLDRSSSHREPVAAGRHRGHAQPRPHHVAAPREGNLFARDDLPVCLRRQRRLLTTGAANTDRRVDQHRRAREHARRRRDADDREISAEPLLAHANGVDGNPSRLESEDRRAEVATGVVCAVGHHDDTRDRQAAEVGAHAVERGGEIGAPAARLEPGPRRCDGGFGGESERPHRVARGQSPDERARVGEFALHRARTARSSHVGHAHAARVVEQDRQHVALRHGAGQHLGRAQQAGEHGHDGERARHPEHHPVDAADSPKLPVRQHDQREGSQHREAEEPDGDDRCEHELASTEEPRRVLEQEGEDGLERCFQSHPDRWTCPTTGVVHTPRELRNPRQNGSRRASPLQELPRGASECWRRPDSRDLPSRALPRESLPRSTRSKRVAATLNRCSTSQRVRKVSAGAWGSGCDRTRTERSPAALSARCSC